MKKLVAIAAALAVAACASAFDDRAEVACGKIVDLMERQVCMEQYIAQGQAAVRQGIGQTLAGAGAAYSRAPSSSYSAPPSAPAAGASGCFFRREETSGFNKICYYDCLGSLRAVTQSSVSLCPLTL